MKKRIDLIAQGKNFLNASRKVRRINRVIDAAIDSADDEIEKFKDQAESIIDKFTSKTEAEEFNEIVNEYVDNYTKMKGVQLTKEAVQELKAALEKEVSEEELEENK